MALAGWPTQNFAASLRNLRTPSNIGVRQAMAIPRFKFTFLVEMTLNPAVVFNTSVGTDINNGHIYGQLKSITYPKPRFEVETLRSYNRYRKIYKRLDYDPATIVWTDDSTSMIQSLVKEYISFYHETGNIGFESDQNPNQVPIDDQQINTDVGIVGNTVRTAMNTRPSLGLKLRPQGMRHFFQSITIYDLGTEPTSINVHTFNTPVIVNFDHDNLDWYSTDIINTTWTFEYESYFFTTGQNIDVFASIMDKMLGGDAQNTQLLPGQ